MIKRLVKLTFQTDKTDDFIHIFETSKTHIRAMSGCQHLELWRDIAQPTVFFTLSHWDTEGSLNDYRKSELFGRTWKKTKILFADKPQAWTTEMLS